MVRIRDDAPSTDYQLYDGFSEDNKSWNMSNQSMSPESWSFFWDGKDWIDSGYELYIQETGWFSVAQIIDTVMASEDQICSELPLELYDGSNSDVFLILNDYDTVVSMEMDTEKMLFCATLSNIPQESEVTIVSISSLGELNYHFGMSNAIIRVGDGDITAVSYTHLTLPTILLV